MIQVLKLELHKIEEVTAVVNIQQVIEANIDVEKLLIQHFPYMTGYACYRGNKIQKEFPKLELGKPLNPNDKYALIYAFTGSTTHLEKE